MQNVTLSIEGMTCGHCVGRVRNALVAVPGVGEVQVALGSARVSYDPGVVGIAQLAEAITAAGYRAAAAPAVERAG